MSNQISIFNFKSNPVRVEIFEQQPHFCLLDVCSVFEIQNSRRVQSEMLDPQGVRQAYILAKDEKQRKTSFINEPNLYRIIFRSEKPIAKEFQNWVFEEVLPQIRKTGKYALQNLPLEEIKSDEEALHIIVNLFHSLNGAYEMGEKIRKGHPYLAKEIDKTIGGSYIYNLNGPTENALTKARKYIHAKSERIMFVKGMLSLLEEPKQIARF
ncbi:MAG: BRO family protein [[Actinobacillus] rossii]|nr:hypothetical protein [[Actinobacillus] rossii]MDY4506109.1 BRO family protein [[Actinobacillus] rossii]